MTEVFKIYLMLGGIMLAAIFICIEEIRTEFVSLLTEALIVLAKLTFFVVLMVVGWLPIIILAAYGVIGNTDVKKPIDGMFSEAEE